MLITVKRNDSDVVLSIETDLANTCNGPQAAAIPFTWPTGQPYAADLLVRYIIERVRKAISDTRREYYEKGWKDAKAKRPKDDWFSGVL
jgi:hypothetical protein